MATVFEPVISKESVPVQISDQKAIPAADQISSLDEVVTPSDLDITTPCPPVKQNNDHDTFNQQVSIMDQIIDKLSNKLDLVITALVSFNGLSTSPSSITMLESEPVVPVKQSETLPVSKPSSVLTQPPEISKPHTPVPRAWNRINSQIKVAASVSPKTTPLVKVKVKPTTTF